MHLIQTKENELKIEMLRLCGLPILFDDDDKMVCLEYFLSATLQDLFFICPRGTLTSPSQPSFPLHPQIRLFLSLTCCILC